MAAIDFLTTISVARVGTIREGYIPPWVDDPASAGAPRRRSRFTRTLKTFDFDVILTDAQAALLRTFVETTTSGGAAEFNWTHPVTLVVYECRFAELPNLQDVTKGVWRTTINLGEI